MDKNEIYSLMDEIINNSKFKDAPVEKKDEVKKLLLQKYLARFNQAAYEILDDNKKPEFQSILNTRNQTQIDTYIGQNITNLEEVSQLASHNFIEDFATIFLDDSSLNANLSN